VGVFALAALMAGTVMAGDSPRSDAPGMRADTDGDGRVHERALQAGRCQW
jgi:hypothetical protein